MKTIDEATDRRRVDYLKLMAALGGEAVELSYNERRALESKMRDASDYDGVPVASGTRVSSRRAHRIRPLRARSNGTRRTRPGRERKAEMRLRTEDRADPRCRVWHAYNSGKLTHEQAGDKVLDVYYTLIAPYEKRDTTETP